MKQTLIAFTALCLLAGCATPQRQHETKLSVYVSDKESPKDKPGVMQSTYEGVYVVDVSRGTERRLDDLGYKSSPIFDPMGQRVAYLSGMPTTVPTEIRICHLGSGKITKVPATGAQRSELCYLPDGETVVYTTVKAIVLLNLRDSTKKSFPVIDAEDISVSPDGGVIVFWRREGHDSNDADGWILYRLDLSTGQSMSAGRKNDGRGVVGKACWHPSGKRFLIMNFDVNDQNERSNIRKSWFSSDLVELGDVITCPNVIMQNRYPWTGMYPGWNR